MAPGPTPLTNERLAAWCDRRLAPVMFWLAAAYLVILGGLLHRLLPSDPTRWEALLILGGLAILWPIFAVDAILRWVLLARDAAPRAARLVVLVPSLAPPLRLAATSYTGAQIVWLPGWGWRPVDHYLRHRLEQAFGVPMIVIALLVLPLLALEYYVTQVRDHPHVARAVEVGNSLIWVAFAVEFIIMASVARSRLAYSARHWLDLAIVLLPVVEFMPLLRLTRVASQAGRLYRLRGLGMRAWRAILVLNVVHRLFGRHHEARLQALRQQLEIKLEEVEILRAEIAILEAKLAEAGPKPEPAGRTESAVPRRREALPHRPTDPEELQ